MLYFVNFWFRFSPTKLDDCEQKGYVCEESSWSIDVPKGKYFVRIIS